MFYGIQETNFTIIAHVYLNCNMCLEITSLELQPPPLGTKELITLR